MPKRCRRIKSLRSWIAPLLFGAALLLFIVDHVFARAGGGGGYHGGGGGGGGFGGGGFGGGHGGGGGSGGGLIFDLIWLLFQYPVVGVPVLIVIVLVIVFSAKQGNSSYQSGVIRRGTEALREDDKTQGIAGIRAHDPNFDVAVFCRRVNLAFGKIQAAWCRQELTPVRPFISDGVHERFLLQFQEQKAAGYRDHMEDIRIDAIDVASVSSDGLFDELSVRIAAAARDWRESLTDGKRISGQTGIEPFVEIWTFLRHRGATTDLSRNGLMEGNCPNCGASIEMNQSANCTHCKALLRSGAYDWVLTEITQASEWEVPRRATLPGVADLKQRDPEFDTVAIEDRASVMFWRKATADRIGKIDPLRKIASPEFSEAYAAQWKGPPGQARQFAADCAVGAVQTMGVIAAEDRERALVSIRWSGTEAVVDPAGRVRNTGNSLWAATLFVLARQASAKTDAGKSVSSAHCPNCGAPESGGASDACEFCGTVLNDGLHGWVLEEVLKQDEPRARELIGQMRESSGFQAGGNGHAASTLDARGTLAWMVKMATADGQVDPREHESLTQFAARWSVGPEQVEGMIAAGLRGDLAAPQPHNDHEARVWLEAMALEAWADGKLTPEELNLLRSVGADAGFSAEDVDLLIRRARARVYQDATAALRARKASS
jgi:DnaJ-domain-containing protein 1